MSAPSLHRESTDSLISIKNTDIYAAVLYQASRIKLLINCALALISMFEWLDAKVDVWAVEYCADDMPVVLYNHGFFRSYICSLQPFSCVFCLVSTNIHVRTCTYAEVHMCCWSYSLQLNMFHTVRACWDISNGLLRRYTYTVLYMYVHMYHTGYYVVSVIVLGWLSTCVWMYMPLKHVLM